MTVIISDSGFSTDDWPVLYGRADILEISSDFDFRALKTVITHKTAIRIEFPHFTDGRGFGIAKILRASGFVGCLRAFGDVLPDQFAMARRVGFDEIEITDDHATRFPEAQWLYRSPWATHDYQQKLQA